MMMKSRIQRLWIEILGRISEKALAGFRMSPHHRHFRLVQASRLVEHFDRHEGLADIVYQATHRQPLDVAPAHSQEGAETCRDPRHEQTMLKRTSVMLPNAVQPGLQSDVLNRIGDVLASGSKALTIRLSSIDTGGKEVGERFLGDKNGRSSRG